MGVPVRMGKSHARPARTSPRRFWRSMMPKSRFSLRGTVSPRIQMPESAFTLWILPREIDGFQELNTWNTATKILISPDLPHVLRPLKDELMQTRAQLPAQHKQNSRICFIPQWPFFELRIQGQSKQWPKTDHRAVTSEMLELDYLLLLHQWKPHAYIQCSIKISFLSYLA